MAEYCDLETLIGRWDALVTLSTDYRGWGRLAATPERQKHPVMCEQRAGLVLEGRAHLQKASGLDFT